MKRRGVYQWRGPSPWLSAWATQLRRDIAVIANRWQLADLTDSEIEPQTCRTDSMGLATELTCEISIIRICACLADLSTLLT